MASEHVSRFDVVIGWLVSSATTSKFTSTGAPIFLEYRQDESAAVWFLDSVFSVSMGFAKSNLIPPRIFHQSDAYFLDRPMGQISS
jgi:hypothetical protein